MRVREQVGETRMPGRRRGGHGGEVELSGSNGDDNGAAGPAPQQISLVRLIFSCMVAGGVQYGWALQLSLLTPYVQVHLETKRISASAVRLLGLHADVYFLLALFFLHSFEQL